MNRKSFWYIVAESKELLKNSVISRSVLDEWLAVFRDNEGKIGVLQDRCLHRSAQLSKGKMVDGHLRCPYHGWTYARTGDVVFIPSEGKLQNVKVEKTKQNHRCAQVFQVLEQDDYIYVRLEPSEELPFKLKNYRRPGYTTIRLQNRFENSVTNCAENFVDIPHTSFVHPRIFRDSKGESLRASIERLGGHVKVDYIGEKKNLGIFKWFLNPKGEEIRHTDEFFAPNVTEVNYFFSGTNHFVITSQSIPVNEKETLVYTDLTYNYGIWNRVSRPIVRKQAQIIIDQDIEILKNQMKTIQRYGAKFANSPCDVIHTFIESIQAEIEKGEDPKGLPSRKAEIEFWV